MTEIFDRMRPIDTDTHVTEPPDLWTSRVASKWGDAIPHTEMIDGREIWVMGEQSYISPGFVTMAGFDGSFPEGPETFADCPESAWDPAARLAFMDGERIHAEVVYPNVGGFGSAGFLKLGEPELMLDCVRAYNDFLTEWTREDPGRLVPVTATPFWDVQATAAEVERCAARGHRAVLMCGQPQDFGQPALSEKYWDPLWSTAQEAGLSISFHIGGGGPNDSLYQRPSLSVRANMARVSGLMFVHNANSLADIIFGGVCQRFPELKFVSVESGVGWLQSVLEGFDWQFMNCQVRRDNPELELLPSEYFKRQIYGCFWFEQRGIEPALTAFPDNLMWETDFPHPTCQHPGPLNTWATRPAEYAERALGDVPEETLRKVLHDNAAALYGLA
ncbi:MAG: amidohydrolase [Proteobacteria bacterium]|nr:amidohydrolase [Pseudomonadota bacterium]